MLQAGTRIGVYEIQAALGAGGMGEVYRALDTTLGRHVAIKVLPESFAQDAERLARFDREARTLAALNHPHIAQIFLADEDEGKPYFVMWHVPVGHRPTLTEARDRLDHLTAHGASDHAFGWEGLPNLKRWMEERCA
jgi:hypothetical protein